MQSRLLYLTFVIATISTACNKVTFQNSERVPTQAVIPVEPVEPTLPATCVGQQPMDETRTIACPSGQSGSIIESRSYSCQDTSWIASAWTQVSNTCNFPTPSLKTGSCQQGDSLTSCLSCPGFQPPKWQPSTKAEKLAYIMFMSCPIHNVSDPKFTPPTLEQTLTLIQACSKELYPETKDELNKFQNTTIDRLLNETNDSMRQKFFKGLWYQPPYTDHFESYFGLYSYEARQMFCYGDSNSVINGTLYTTEWYQHCGGDPNGFQCQSWLQNKKLSKQFFRVQEIRKQLHDCIGKSIELKPVQPWQPPKCEFRTFEGFFEAGGQQELETLTNQGFSFSIEYKNQCYQPNAVLPDMSGEVKISGYRCQ